MRKYPIALLSLLLVFAVGSIFAVRALDAPIDAVGYTETVVSGDPSAAAGLCVGLTEQLRYHLRWDSSIRLTDRDYTAETAFSFHESTYWQNDVSGEQRLLQSLEIYDGLDLGDTFSPLNEALNTLAERAAPASTATASIRLADLYDYYPLDFTIFLPDNVYATSNLTASSVSDREQAVLAQLDAYFRIPVLDNHYYLLSVDKNADGLTGSSSAGFDDERGDSFSFCSESVLGDGAFYFWFSNRTYKDAVVDTSLIPGGYGLYRLPFGQSNLNPDTPELMQGDVFPEQMTTIYTLDPSARILHLSITPDKQTLLLQTIEDDCYYLTVLDAPSGAVRQKLPLLTMRSDEPALWSESVDGENFLFIRPLETEFFLLTPDSDGQWYIAIDHHSTALEQQEDFLPWYTSASRALAFDGTRLAIVGTNRRGTAQYPARLYESCGFYAAVYTADGLQYYGRYDSTLDAANAGLSNSDNDLIQPAYYCDPTAVWQ